MKWKFRLTPGTKKMPFGTLYSIWIIKLASLQGNACSFIIFHQNLIEIKFRTTQFKFCVEKSWCYHPTTRTRQCILQFETLSDTVDAKDYKKALERLTEHFTPQHNIEYKTYLFRQARQPQNEMGEFNMLRTYSLLFPRISVLKTVLAPMQICSTKGLVKRG